jgi:hypothetical protein
MRRAGVLALLSAAGTLSAAHCAAPPDSELRAGITEEELKAPPSSHEIRAAITNDARKQRVLRARLDEGRSDCPWVVRVEGQVLCAADQTPVEFYLLWEDPLDVPNRVDERALFCRKESVYFYHYKGGPRRLDVWMGPYKIDRRRVLPDDH